MTGGDKARKGEGVSSDMLATYDASKRLAETFRRAAPRGQTVAPSDTSMKGEKTGREATRHAMK